MLKLACVFLLTIAGGLGDSVTDGTTLVMAFMANRHGDRTPTSSSVSMSTNVDAVEAISAKYGYGQLTDLGKARAYGFGKFIRSRYDSLLSPQYNRSEIYIRSTDSTRAKMTILTAMAAVYPAYPDSWSDQVNWVPVPYTTVPIKYDFNLATLNCPTFIAAEYTNMMSTSPRMDPYADVLSVVANVSGSTALADYPAALAYSFYDVYKSQQSLGVPLGDQIDAVMPGLKEAAGVAMDIIFGDKNSKLNAGVMLNEFITYAEEIIAGIDTPRVRVYSAHDINVYAFESVAQVTPRQGVPKYASCLSLELRKVVDTDKYVVLGVYQPSPGEDLIYLPIAGCGDNILCDYETYKNIVSSYLLDEHTWRTECGFSDDITIDDSSVA